MLKNLWELASSFFKIGLFSFGGGLAMVPLILTELEKHGWMNSDAFFDLFSMAQMTPGAIAMNTATYIGTSVAGIPGGLIATSFLAAPSIIVMLLLSGFLRRIKENKVKDAIFAGLKPITIALILFAGWQIAEKTFFQNQFETINWKGIILCLACGTISFSIKKVHPILLIVLAGMAGVFLF